MSGRKNTTPAAPAELVPAETETVTGGTAATGRHQIKTFQVADDQPPADRPTEEVAFYYNKIPPG